MKKNNTDYLIHIIIKKHIETKSRDETDFAEKCVSYSILQEITETNAEEFEFAPNYVEKQKVKRIMVKAKKEFFDYLVNVNKYNHRILELYVMLENLLND